MELEKYKYYLKNSTNDIIELDVNDKVFYPTATSLFLIDAAKKNDVKR